VQDITWSCTREYTAGDYSCNWAYDPVTWARLPVLEGGDSGWSDVFAVPVTVTRPACAPEVIELGITWPVKPDL
jgi:hypothetical protein